MKYINEIKKYLDNIFDVINIKPTYSINEVNHKKIRNLALGQQGVYLFLFKEDDRFYKIGKCGYKSNPRWISQHYVTLPKVHESDTDRAMSTLSQSLLEDKKFAEQYHLVMEKKEMRKFIEKNFDRINIVIENEKEKFVMNLIEALLHLKYKPKYEKG